MNESYIVYNHLREIFGVDAYEMICSSLMYMMLFCCAHTYIYDASSNRVIDICAERERIDDERYAERVILTTNYKETCVCITVFILSL